MEKIDTRKLKPEVQQQLRYQAIRLRKDGRTYVEIGEIVGVHPTNVCKWWKAYEHGGQKAIRQKKRGRRPGSCRTLSKNQECQLQRMIRDKCPDQLNLPFYLWTRIAVQQLIEQLWSIRMPTRTVGEYLKRWGFTPQKPILQRGERDEDEIIRWKTEKFIKIRNASRKRNAHLVFIDETGFMLSPLRRRSYAPRGQPPVIKVRDPHGRISVIAAITVSPVRQRTNLMFNLLSDNANFNSHAIVQFINYIYKRISNSITILWDSIPIHGSQAVINFINGIPEIISDKLPTYAPELNPVDRIWAYLKYGRLANYSPSDLDQLRNTVKTELIKLRKRTDLLHAFIRNTGLDLR